MNTFKFRNNLMRLLCSSEGEEPFHSLRMMTGGLSSPKTAKIINYAVQCCDPEKDVYVEIGTYSGYTLAAAGYQNNVQCIGIDDLSMSMEDFFQPHTKEEEESRRNDVRTMIGRSLALIRNKSVSFVERDFRTIEKLEFKPTPKTISIAYLDGYHDYEQTKKAFEWVEPQLADDAIVIYDDLHMPQVYRAVLEQVFNGKCHILALAKHTPEEGIFVLDEYISTGLAVLQYERKK